MNQEEKAFIIRAYDKAELAELYSPGRTAAAALQTLYAGCGETCCYRKN